MKRELEWSFLLILGIVGCASEVDDIAERSDDLTREISIGSGYRQGWSMTPASTSSPVVAYAQQLWSGGSSWSPTIRLARANAAGTTWQVSDIVTSNQRVPQLADPSVAVGPDGRVLVVYTDRYDIKLASESGAGAFDVSTVYAMTGNNDAKKPVMAIEPSGVLHLAYLVSEWPKTALWHAQKPVDGGWQFERVGSHVRAGAPQLRLGGGLVHIAYQESPDNALQQIRYASRPLVGGTWATMVISAGETPSLAMDASGTPHVSFQRDAALLHAFRVGATWQEEKVADSIFPVALTHVQPRVTSSLDVNRSGAVGIAFTDAGYLQNTLRYAYKTSSATSFTVKTLRENTGHPQVAFSPRGRVNLLFGEESGLRAISGSLSLP